MTMKKSTSLAVISLITLFCFSEIATAQTNRFTVQLEAAPTVEAAQERVKQFQAQGLDAYIVRSQVPGKGTFYRIRVGMFSNQAEARKYGADLQKQGIVSEFFIAAYERPQADIAQLATTTADTPAKPATSPSVKEQPPVVAKAGSTSKPVVNQPDTSAGNGPNTGLNAALKNSPPVSNPVANSTAASTPASTTPAATAAAISFVRFQDPSIGYSFDRPQYWEGGPLDPKDAQDQKVNAGALFKSYQDSAFINAIWNNLDKANSPDNDNDLIIELILRSMGSGDGTQQMMETGRKVVSESGTIKTYLDLRATFKAQGQDGPLDFLGKAVIVRANKGILLVVAFYSKNGPTYVSSVAERIIASVRPPE
jgi:hypothetical protein